MSGDHKSKWCWRSVMVGVLAAILLTVAAALASSPYRARVADTAEETTLKGLPSAVTKAEDADRGTATVAKDTETRVAKDILTRAAKPAYKSKPPPSQQDLALRESADR